MINQETKELILSTSRNEDIIQDFQTLKKSGKDYKGDCPQCGAKNKFSVSPAKNIYKCYSCDWGGNNPVKYLCEVKKMKFPEALEYMAKKYGISITNIPKGPQKKNKVKELTFRDIQLASSGISEGDQKTLAYIDDDTQKEVDLFVAATINEYGQEVPGDDMIINYYDLDGKQIMYQKDKSTKMLPLLRIRYQFPEHHLDKDGKPVKYRSPYKSGSHLFIPPQIREAYQSGRQIKRLFIQEGEKKALKCCIHGISSVGIMGIQNIAHNGQLPYDFQLLIKRCNVEEVIFVLDSDYDHLSNNLKRGSRIDQRPRSFFYAVKNFREYFKAFVNQGVYLQIYFGHVLENEHGEKGIDDLMANQFKLKEKEIYDDINSALNEKAGTGKYFQFYNISTMSDTKLMEIWSLQDIEEFCNKYKEQLANLEEFYFSKTKWKFNESGKIIPYQPLEEDEQYWKKEVFENPKTGFQKTSFKFSYTCAYNFLFRRGFGRIMMSNRNYQFCEVDNKIVKIVEPYQIRDYMIEFTKGVVPREERTDVLDFLYRGGKMYFGPDSLGHLDFVKPRFELADKNFQYIFFKEKYWKITAEGIEEKPLSTLPDYVWEDKINDFDATWLGNDFMTVKRIDQSYLKKIEKPIREMYDVSDEDLETLIGNFNIAFSEASQKCHFMKFLVNTSDFYWYKHLHPETRTPAETDNRSMTEAFESNLHLLSKLTAMGYLLHKFRDKSCEKAVIAMDGKNSEVGDSNGRTGKSLLGMAIGKVIPQVYIGGKSKDLVNDAFLFEEVDEKTDNVFIDDVRANIDFEFFFPIITGKMQINAKGARKFTLSEQETPKIYLTTNHAISGTTSSFRDRQFLIAFSDYYDDNYKPINDFGVNFFSEWDHEQWNLFYNLVAYSLVLYFKALKEGWGVSGSGLIQPPIERLERRKMRQYFGENFLLWADEYFGVTETDSGVEIDATNANINEEKTRKDLYESFMDQAPSERKFTTAQRFKNKFRTWAQYRELVFNPYQEDKRTGKKHGGDIKKGGIEYFRVSKLSE